MEITDSPLHILIGEDDNWVPADACVDLVSLADLDNVKITTYPNSHHSFDSQLPITNVERGYSLTDCSFKIRDDGAVLMNFLNIPMTSPILQKIGLSFCASRGTTLGGNVDARNSVPAPKRVKENVLDNICNLPIVSSCLFVTLSLLISALSNLGALVVAGWGQPFYHRHNVCTNDQKEGDLGRLDLQNHQWGGPVFVLLPQRVLR